MATTFNNKDNLKELYASADLAGRKFLWLSTITGGFFGYSLIKSFAESFDFGAEAMAGSWAYPLKAAFLAMGIVGAYYLDAKLISPMARAFFTEFSGWYSSTNKKYDIERFTGFRMLSMWITGALLACLCGLSFLVSYRGPEITVAMAIKQPKENQKPADLTKARVEAVDAETKVYADKLARLEKEEATAVDAAQKRAPAGIKKSYESDEEYGHREMAVIINKAKKPYTPKIEEARKQLEEKTNAANAKFDKQQERAIQKEDEEDNEQKDQANTIEFIIQWSGVAGLAISLFGIALWSLGVATTELDRIAIQKARDERNNGAPAAGGFNAGSKTAHHNPNF